MLEKLFCGTVPARKIGGQNWPCRPIRCPNKVFVKHWHATQKKFKLWVFFRSLASPLSSKRCLPGIVRPILVQKYQIPSNSIRTASTPSCYSAHLDSRVKRFSTQIVFFFKKREGTNWFYADGYLNRWWEYVNSFSHLITNVTLFTKLMLMLNWPAAFIAHCIPRAFTTPTSQWAPERRRRFLDCPSPALRFGPRNRLFTFLQF